MVICLCVNLLFLVNITINLSSMTKQLLIDLSAIAVIDHRKPQSAKSSIVVMYPQVVHNLNFSFMNILLPDFYNNITQQLVEIENEVKYTTDRF